MIPFDLQKLTAEAAITRALRGPTLEPNEHRVTLAAPETEIEHWERWDEPQAWCREYVLHGQGERWNRRRERDGSLVFTFSNYRTAVHFALRFAGI